MEMVKTTTATDTLMMQFSIEDLRDEVRIYPNPVHNFLVIEMENARRVEVSIFTPGGKLIQKQQMDFSSGVEEIDFSPFPQGLYFMFFTDEQGQLILSEKVARF